MFYRLGVGQSTTKCRLKIILNQNRFMSRLEAAQVLGVDQNSSPKEIKNAYIELAKLYHPDSKVNFHHKSLIFLMLIFRLAAIKDFVEYKPQMKFYYKALNHEIQ